MAVRMTVHQAADLWRVNRRTILKWIMGKDASGRGKRLVEGKDYEAIDTEFPGRKMYILLREDYPVPSNVTPIPRKSRGRRADKPVMEPPPGENFFEKQVRKVTTKRKHAEEEVPAESIRQPRNVFERAEAERHVEEAPVAPPKPKRRSKATPMTLETEAPVEEAAPIIEEPLEKKSIRQQIAEIVPSMTNDPEDLENPAAAIPRIVAVLVTRRLNYNAVVDLAKADQSVIEKGLRRVLDDLPLTPDAKQYVGGMVMELFVKFYKRTDFSDSASYGGYWPRTVQLSGFLGTRMLPPYAGL